MGCYTGSRVWGSPGCRDPAETKSLVRFLEWTITLVCWPALRSFRMDFNEVGLQNCDGTLGAVL